ncbi:unnamed protein product [Rhizoctonia solani]|uniref:Uncharacterized protein n=1 Tax=Rhizoctonia solani TaxID=456999 RepID=A0A8H3GHM0_9AGAM|nr:unnamed protein product [Rhizoctonia solani]
MERRLHSGGILNCGQSITTSIHYWGHDCILVKSATTTYGYLYKSFNDIGEYGQFQPNQADALVVSLSYVVGSSASVDMTATNGRSAAYPYVGAFSSFGNLGSSSNDLSPGSSNFGFVGATKQTPAGSPPVVGDTAFSEATGMPADYESAIWIYDPLTNVINAQWINTDGSAPETYLVYTRDADADLILMTGDPVAMRRDYAGDYPELSANWPTNSRLEDSWFRKRPFIEDPERRVRQDKEIFETARLINCGSFVSVVCKHFDVSNEDLSIQLDAMFRVSLDFHVKEVAGSTKGSESARPKQSLFGRIQPSLPLARQRTRNRPTTVFTKQPGKVELPDFYETLVKFRSRDVHNPDGHFSDTDLAGILHNANENGAPRYGARGSPRVLRIIEIMGIEQARKWGHLYDERV